LKCGFKEWVGGWVDGWVDGWAVSEECADRWAESEDKGGVWVYEAYEEKRKQKNYAVFYFAGKDFFFMFMM
jgi:hypothetical protein